MKIYHVVHLWSVNFFVYLFPFHKYIHFKKCLVSTYDALDMVQISGTWYKLEDHGPCPHETELNKELNELAIF